jgi:hypothetical protein
VTQASCTGEDGTYYDGGSCNTETGMCTSAATPTPVPAKLSASLATDRGCGSAAVYAVGEPITVSFEVVSNSSAITLATATLFDQQGNVQSQLFQNKVLTGQPHVLTGLTVSPPTGQEILVLHATAPGATDGIRTCSFEVVAAPTPSAAPAPSPTPTPEPGCCQFTSPSVGCALVTAASGCDGAQFLPGMACNAANGLCDGFVLPSPSPTPPIAQRQLYFDANDVHDGGEITVVINVFPPGGGDPTMITATVMVAPGDDAATIASKWASAFQTAANGKVNCSVDVRPTDSPNIWCVFIQCTNATSIGVTLPPLGSIPLGTAVGPNAIFPTPSPSNTRTITPTRTAVISVTATKTNTITATATRTNTGTPPTPTSTSTATNTPTPVDTPTAPPMQVHMDLQIYRLNGTRLLDDEGGDVDLEETVGSMVCINNDNDNHNDGFDIDEQNVAGENDLIRMVARRPPIPATGTAQLVATRGGDKVRVWTTSGKAAEVILPAQFDVSQLPMEFWVEGIDGSTAQRDVQFELDGPAAPGVVAIPDRVDLTVIQISQSAWVGHSNSVTDGDMLDADPHDPHWPGALRVFPDARAAGGAARNTVRVRVTLSVEPVEDWNIYLRSFDVDDPAPFDNDVDPNDEGLGGTYPHTNIGYTADEDNRGAVNGHKAGELAGQDADGIATLTFPAGTNQEDIDFQVTMQPGDNFRVAAVCDRTYLPELQNFDLTDDQNIVDSNNELPIRDAEQQVTPVLTVWRRLHLERDSMAALGGLNTLAGMITDVEAGPFPDTSEVTINQALSDDGRYQCPAGTFPMPCHLQVGMRQFDTSANTSGAGSTVTVDNDAAGAPPNNAAFTLHDDDSDDLLPALPENDLVQDTDAAATNVLAAAYIRPVADGGGAAANDQMDLAAHLNVELAGEPAQIAAGQNANGDNDFWVSYTQMDFQGPLSNDNDPDGERDSVWGAGTIYGDTPRFGRASVLYRESYRDDCGGLDAAAFARSGIAVTIAHEIGHQFFAQHTDLGIMDQGCLKPDTTFSDASLNRIRSVPRVGLGARPGLAHALAAEWQERMQGGSSGATRSAAEAAGLNLSIAVDKTAFIVGEPVPVHFTLTNTSSASVTGNFELTFRSARLGVMITPQNGNPYALVSLATQVGQTEDAALRPTTLAPGQSVTTTQLISYDVNLGGFALPSPGTYMLAATFFYDAHDYNNRVDSNALTISVTQPTGADVDALAFLTTNNLQLFLTPEGALSPTDLVSDQSLRMFLTMHAGSTYAPYARAGLGTMCSIGLDPLACAPLGCTGDCSGDGTVTVAELITGVNIVLGSEALDRCPSFDCNGSGTVTIDCLIRAVGNLLNGCQTLSSPVS